ncbi:glycine/proline betaine ABC transporter permease subunit OpuAB, partial [Enterococcus faecalis]
TLIGVLLIDYLGYWDPMLQTLALVLTSVIISIVVGVPIGIWASQKETVRRIVTPILDLMQTMPAFVYLLPAIFFFNIGV